MANNAIVSSLSRPQALLAELNKHTPYDTREERSLTQTCNLLNTMSDKAFTREHSHRHITGSAFVISNQGLLLHLHKKIKLWIQPGGHLDENETTYQAALRETKEETGVVPDLSNEIFYVDVHETPSGHTHFDIRYLGYSDDLKINPGEDESQSVEWFTPEKCMTLTDPAITGTIEKLVKQDKFLKC